MRRTTLAFLAAVLTLVLWITTAHAMPQCSTREVMIGSLLREYGEVVIGRGILSNGSIIELFVNRSTGTWSMLTSSPKGPTCVVATGSYWSTAEPKEGEAI